MRGIEAASGNSESDLVKGFAPQDQRDMLSIGTWLDL
jgi:hypothetical protein